MEREREREITIMRIRWRQDHGMRMVVVLKLRRHESCDYLKMQKQYQWANGSTYGVVWEE